MHNYAHIKKKLKLELFKSTARKVMSEQQKAATIEAVEEACLYLGRQSEMYSGGIRTDLKNGYSILRDFGKAMHYLDRIGDMIKGEIRSRNWRRIARRLEIESRARRIAEETGADFEEVREMLFRCLPEYIGNEY